MKLNVRKRARAKKCALACFLAIVVLVVVARTTCLISLACNDNPYMGVPTIHGLSTESVPGARYAIATLVTWRPYEEYAMTLCWSLRRGIAKWPEDVDLLALVTATDGVDLEVLRRCFDRVERAVPFAFATDLWVASVDSLLVLNETRYRRVVYMEADLLAVRAEALLKLVKLPVRFAGVVGFKPAWWQGGVFAVEPNERVLSGALRRAHQRHAEGRVVDNEGSLTHAFPEGSPGVFVLPLEYDLEPVYSNHWNHIQEAVAIHFSFRKPTRTTVCANRGLYKLWSDVNAEAREKYSLKPVAKTRTRFRDVVAEVGALLTTGSCGPEVPSHSK